MKGMFLIGSALRVDNRLSVFDNKTRFEQTLETIKSIDKHCPDSVRFIVDASANPADEEYVRELASLPNTWYIDMSNHDWIKMFSSNGLRSQSETYSFIGFLDWLKKQDFKADRFYKISGRYTLTDDFVLDDPSYKNAFVFAKALDSWMPLEQQKVSGASKLFRLRLWHMDFNLLDTFDGELQTIFQDCADYHIDVEYSYWKHLHKYNVVELDKIGVKGIIAPSGEHIDE